MSKAILGTALAPWICTAREVRLGFGSAITVGSAGKGLEDGRLSWEVEAFRMYLPSTMSCQAEIPAQVEHHVDVAILIPGHSPVQLPLHSTRLCDVDKWPPLAGTAPLHEKQYLNLGDLISPALGLRQLTVSLSKILEKLRVSMGKKIKTNCWVTNA